MTLFAPPDRSRAGKNTSRYVDEERCSPLPLSLFLSRPTSNDVSKEDTHTNTHTSGGCTRDQRRCCRGERCDVVTGDERSGAKGLPHATHASPTLVWRDKDATLPRASSFSILIQCQASSGSRRHTHDVSLGCDDELRIYGQSCNQRRDEGHVTQFHRVWQSRIPGPCAGLSFVLPL